jgi:hypothetical protein
MVRGPAVVSRDAAHWRNQVPELPCSQTTEDRDRPILQLRVGVPVGIPVGSFQTG